MSAPKQGVVASISALGMGVLDTQDCLGLDVMAQYGSLEQLRAWYRDGTPCALTPPAYGDPSYSLATGQVAEQVGSTTGGAGHAEEASVGAPHPLANLATQGQCRSSSGAAGATPQVSTALLPPNQGSRLSDSAGDAGLLAVMGVDKWPTSSVAVRESPPVFYRGALPSPPQSPLHNSEDLNGDPEGAAVQTRVGVVHPSTPTCGSDWTGLLRVSTLERGGPGVGVGHSVGTPIGQTPSLPSTSDNLDAGGEWQVQATALWRGDVQREERRSADVELDVGEVPGENSRAPKSLKMSSDRQPGTQGGPQPRPAAAATAATGAVGTGTRRQLI